MVATAVAAVTTLVTGAIVTGVQNAAGRLSPPIDVAVERLLGCPAPYVVPGRVETIPTPPPADVNPQDRDRWALNLGGAEGEVTAVRVTVTGTAESPVVLQDLRFDVLERRQPIDGILTKAACGDALPERLLDVDLEPTPPVLVGSYDYRYLDSDKPDTPEEPVRFPYTVSTSSVEQLVVLARATRCPASGRRGCCGPWGTGKARPSSTTAAGPSSPTARRATPPTSPTRASRSRRADPGPPTAVRAGATKRPQDRAKYRRESHAVILPGWSQIPSVMRHPLVSVYGPYHRDAPPGRVLRHALSWARLLTCSTPAGGSVSGTELGAGGYRPPGRTAGQQEPGEVSR